MTAETDIDPGEVSRSRENAGPTHESMLPEGLPRLEEPSEVSEVQDSADVEQREELVERLRERPDRSSMLDSFGWLLRFIGSLLFAHVLFEKRSVQNLRDVSKRGTPVYVMQTRSLLDYLYFNYVFLERDLPLARFANGIRMTWLRGPISWIKRLFSRSPSEKPEEQVEALVCEDEAVFLFLEKPRTEEEKNVEFSQRYLTRMIRAQRKVDTPIFLVPMLLVWEKRPDPKRASFLDDIFGTAQRPGFFRKFVSFFQTFWQSFLRLGQPLVQISTTINLREFLREYPNAGSADASELLRERVSDYLDRERHVVLGPTGEKQGMLFQEMMQRPAITDAVREIAEEEDVDEEAIRERVREQIEEIAASPSMLMIKVMSSVLSFVWYRIYDGFEVDEEGLERVREAAKSNSVVLIPSHKSHIDYLILSFVLYHNNMPCPHIAAGKNLSFWPLGPLFRSGGAFFIRRTFRGAVLYAKVFSEYVYKLLEEGFNVEFFIEGGRSRTGKLIQPKFGLLSILINAFREGASQDLIFAPVYIGYDRVPEESAYLHELEGGQKKPESLWQVIKARKFLKKRYGKIYIQFHEPFSLKDYLESQSAPIEEMTSKEQNGLVRYLGYRFINSIDHVTVITPHAIVAGAALNCAKERFTYDHLMADVETYVNHLFLLEAKLADTLLIDYSHAIAYVFETYVYRKFLERIPPQKGVQQSQDLYRVNETRRPVLDYYKNNGIVYFIPAAFTAMAILERDAFQFSTEELFGSYTFLRDFFNNEFAFDVDRTPEHFVRKTIKIFMADAILMPHPELRDTYNLTSAGYRKLKLFASFLRTYFESYWIVLNVFMRYPKSFLDTKNRTKKIASMGNRMYKRKEVERIESLSLLNYKNAVDYFTTHGIRGSEDSEAIDKCAKTIRRYLNRISP